MYQKKIPYVKYYFSDGPRAEKMFSRIPRKADDIIIKYDL